MRIGFDAKRAFFNDTGLGVYSRDVIDIALSDPETESVFLYTPPVKKAQFAHFFNGKPKIHLREPSGFTGKWFPSLWRSFGISQQCRQDNLNVFHGLSFELPAGIRKTGIRSVVNIHDLIFLKFPSLYSFIDRQVYEWKTRSSSRQADAVITISRKTKEDLCHYTDISPDKVHVIYPSCSDRFREKLSPGTLDAVRLKYKIPSAFMLFVSSITERKNLITLLRAFSRIRHKTETVLVVVGSGYGNYLKQVHRVVAEEKLDQRVLFMGHVADSDLPALYQAASLFVYPSFYEGFGLPVLEALASGTPVLAASGSCLEEAGGKASLYTDPKDEEEMSDKLLVLLTDETLRARLKEKGQERAALFTPEKSRDTLLKLYRSIL